MNLEETVKLLSTRVEALVEQTVLFHQEHKHLLLANDDLNERLMCQNKQLKNSNVFPMLKKN